MKYNLVIQNGKTNKIAILANVGHTHASVLAEIFDFSTEFIVSCVPTDTLLTEIFKEEELKNAKLLELEAFTFTRYSNINF